MIEALIPSNKILHSRRSRFESSSRSLSIFWLLFFCSVTSLLLLMHEPILSGLGGPGGAACMGDEKERSCGSRNRPRYVFEVNVDKQPGRPCEIELPTGTRLAELTGLVLSRRQGGLFAGCPS